MHSAQYEQFAERKKYIERKRFPRLLPLGITSLVIYAASIITGMQVWVQWVLLIFTLTVLMGVVWQEFARRLDMIEYPDCAICGSSKHNELFYKDGLGMVQCVDCKQVFARPRFAAFRRWFFLQFFSLRDAVKCARSKHPIDTRAESGYNSRLAVIEKHVQHSGTPKLIDIGCGCGQLPYLARSRGFQVWGIEPGLFSALCGRFQYGLTMHNVSLQRFLAGNNEDKYDVVSCFHVIEHVADPLAFVSSIKRMLTAQSVLILATPNLGCERAEELGPAWEVVGPSDHIFLFDKESLTRLCVRAGYKVIDSLVSGEHQDELVLIAGLES
jgi:SAM-dependent methyltransferase